MTRHMAAAVCILAVLVGLAGAPMRRAQAEEKGMERTVTVSASGEVSADPDIATVSTGVMSEANTAREALDRNTALMAKLLAGVKAAGVDPKDIQTSNISVQPRYTNPREGQAPVINGYTVSNSVNIRARDLKRLGELLDSLVSLGANQMNGLTFEVSKAEALKDEARKAAIANARRRAELFALAAGAQVGDVISISEETSHPGPRPYAMSRNVMAEAMPVEAGTQSLEARVTVTWALK